MEMHRNLYRVMEKGLGFMVGPVAWISRSRAGCRASSCCHITARSAPASEAGRGTQDQPNPKGSST